MKHGIVFIFLCVLCACQRLDAPADVPSFAGTEIVFDAIDQEDDVETKVTPVTSLFGNNAFYAGFSASKYNDANLYTTWMNIAFSETGSGTHKFKGGKYWPNDPSYPSYTFAASNVLMTNVSETLNGQQTFVPCISMPASALDTDIICVYNASVTHGAECPMVFRHIFARLGKLTITAEDGYTISNVTVTIYDGHTFGSSYYYNMKNGTFSNPVMANPLSSTRTFSIANSTPGEKANDICFIPGVYTVRATWTATKGGYTESFDVTDTVDLERAKLTDLSAELGGEAAKVTFGVTVHPWNTDSKVLEFPVS